MAVGNGLKWSFWLCMPDEIYFLFTLFSEKREEVYSTDKHKYLVELIC